MKDASKLIDKLESVMFDLTESERIKLLEIAFQFKDRPTTLELMGLEKILKEFSV